MGEYIRQLRACVREHKTIFEEDCPQPCLDALWWHYGEYHNMDSPQTKEGFKNLRDCLDSLPIKDSDQSYHDGIYVTKQPEFSWFPTDGNAESRTAQTGLPPEKARPGGCVIKRVWGVKAYAAQNGLLMKS